MTGIDEATMPDDLLRSLMHPEVNGGHRVGGWDVVSEPGRSNENQDAWGCRHSTFVVADGMGGRPGGAVAAQAAVDAGLDVFSGDEVIDPLDWSRRMCLVNDAVMAAGRRAGHERVGAAIGIVRCHADGVVISHVGDVRIYRLRSGGVELLTRDHSVVDEIRAAGLDPDGLSGTAARLDALTAFLGGVDSWRDHSLRVLAGRDADRLVICSDGVHRSMWARDWLESSNIGDCGTLADAMVTRARTNDSRDDRTALAVSLEVGS